MTLTKQQCTELIDRLADKSLTFGCEVEYVKISSVESVEVGSKAKIVFYFQGKFILEGGIGSEEAVITKVLGHPILLGDVLKAIQYEGQQLTHYISRRDRILERWEPCDVSQSLQQIIERLEWEDGECDEPHCDKGHYPLGMDEDDAVDWGACPRCKPLDGFSGIPQLAKSSPEADLVQSLVNLFPKK